MVWLNDRRTPRVHRAMPVRASYGPCKGIFNVFHILRDPCGTRKGTVRHPYGHVRELMQPELTKIPHRRRIWPHGLFSGCLGYQNPYGARKLIMHALKLYGPHTGRQNSYGATRGPCGPREWTYDFSSKQSGNSPGTAVRGPGVWCDWGITVQTAFVASCCGVVLVYFIHIIRCNLPCTGIENITMADQKETKLWVYFLWNLFKDDLWLAS